MVCFGRSAVVTQRNGNLFLLFRVGNVRSSHLLESHVRAQLIQKVVTEEGENIFFHQHELKVKKSLKDRSKLFISCKGWYSARWWGGQSLAAVAGHCRPPVSSSWPNHTLSILLWLSRIDKTSPLWNLSPRDLLNSNFEIVVSLEGSIEATGSTTQVRTIWLHTSCINRKILVG